MKKHFNPTVLAIILIVVAIVSRVVNTEAQFWLNFSMIGGISLFAGAVIKQKRLAFLVPLLAFLISDIYLQIFYGSGFYGISQIFTYGGMVLIVLLGSRIQEIKAWKVLGYSIGGTLLFWIVSNFGVWFGNVFQQFEPGLGLAATFIRALPFLQGNGAATELFLGSLFSDLLFSSTLFAAYFLYMRSAARFSSAA